MLAANEKKWANIVPDMNQRENKDPTGYRIGVAPMEELSKKLKDAASDARKYISKDKAKNKIELDLKELEEQFSLLRGAVMIAYPAYHGLPEWEQVYLILEDKINFLSAWPDCDVRLV